MSTDIDTHEICCIIEKISDPDCSSELQIELTKRLSQVQNSENLQEIADKMLLTSSNKNVTWFALQFYDLVIRCRWNSLSFHDKDQIRNKLVFMLFQTDQSKNLIYDKLLAALSKILLQETDRFDDFLSIVQRLIQKTHLETASQVLFTTVELATSVQVADISPIKKLLFKKFLVNNSKLVMTFIHRLIQHPYQSQNLPSPISPLDEASLFLGQTRGIAVNTSASYALKTFKILVDNHLMDNFSESGLYDEVMLNLLPLVSLNDPQSAVIGIDTIAVFCALIENNLLKHSDELSLYMALFRVIDNMLILHERCLDEVSDEYLCDFNRLLRVLSEKFKASLGLAQDRISQVLKLTLFFALAQPDLALTASCFQVIKNITMNIANDRNTITDELFQTLSEISFSSLKCYSFAENASKLCEIDDADLASFQQDLLDLLFVIFHMSPPLEALVYSMIVEKLTYLKHTFHSESASSRNRRMSLSQSAAFDYMFKDACFMLCLIRRASSTTSVEGIADQRLLIRLIIDLSIAIMATNKFDILSLTSMSELFCEVIAFLGDIFSSGQIIDAEMSGVIYRCIDLLAQQKLNENLQIGIADMLHRVYKQLDRGYISSLVLKIHDIAVNLVEKARNTLYELSTCWILDACGLSSVEFKTFADSLFNPCNLILSGHHDMELKFMGCQISFTRSLKDSALQKMARNAFMNYLISTSDASKLSPAYFKLLEDMYDILPDHDELQIQLTHSIQRHIEALPWKEEILSSFFHWAGKTIAGNDIDLPRYALNIRKLIDESDDFDLQKSYYGFLRSLLGLRADNAIILEFVDILDSCENMTVYGVLLDVIPVILGNVGVTPSDLRFVIHKLFKQACSDRAATVLEELVVTVETASKLHPKIFGEEAIIIGRGLHMSNEEMAMVISKPSLFVETVVFKCSQLNLHV